MKQRVYGRGTSQRIVIELILYNEKTVTDGPKWSFFF